MISADKTSVCLTVNNRPIFKLYDPSKVFDNLKYEYDIITDMSILENSLKSNKYDLAFVDINLITATISSTIQNVAIISSGKDVQEHTVQKGETLVGTPSKEDIANIVNKYRG